MSEIIVTDYNPEWVQQFNQMAADITGILGEHIIEIHHIGSTAIPGIKAKPIIDIMPVVKLIAKVDDCNKAMENAGYKPYGEYGIVGRRHFVKFDAAGRRLANIHCFEQSTPEMELNIMFRDYMRAHAEEAQQYSTLKAKLAKMHAYDHEAYYHGKDSFIKSIIAKTGFDRCYLREVRTQNEWQIYHHIRKTQIFDRHSDIEYDPKHPSIFSPNIEHYVFYKGAYVIGTIMIEKLPENTVAFRLIAIDQNMQNQGLGTSMLKQAENIAKGKGYQKILLHANARAYNFYRRNGYKEMVFDEMEEDQIFEDTIDMGKFL